MTTDEIRRVIAERLDALERERRGLRAALDALAPEVLPSGPPETLVAQRGADAPEPERAPKPEPRKRGRRPTPPAPPPSPVGTLPMHMCHKCGFRSKFDPCPRCGAKVPVIPNLASLAPSLTETADDE